VFHPDRTFSEIKKGCNLEAFSFTVTELCSPDALVGRTNITVSASLYAYNNGRCRRPGEEVSPASVCACMCMCAQALGHYICLL